jgi:hypothetical protein
MRGHRAELDRIAIGSCPSGPARGDGPVRRCAQSLIRGWASHVEGRSCGFRPRQGRAGPGRVRGRRPWASGGDRRLGLAARVGGSGGRRRCGRVAARSRCPAWSRFRRSSGRLGGPRGRRRSSGSDSRAGFAARARTSVHCSSFYGGPAAAGDPVARRRLRVRRRPAPWAGRGLRRRGAVGGGPRA